MRDHDEKQLTPYSLRHTFKDRADSVGSPIGFSNYLLGHRSKNSSVVHESYGTGIPPKRLVDTMEKTWVVEDWGTWEEND